MLYLHKNVIEKQINFKTPKSIQNKNCKEPENML